MKVKSFFILFLITILFAACKGNQKTQTSENQMTDMEKSMTEADTVAIRKLIDSYFTAWETGKYYDAASMLYHATNSTSEEPTPYTNEEMERMVKVMQAMPIISHRIGYIKILESFCNEVMCHAIIAKANGKMPEIATKFYMKPIFYMGAWLLTVADSESGNNAFVDGEDADSLEQKLKTYDKNNK